MNNDYDILIYYKNEYNENIYKTGIYKIYFIERPEYFYIGKATSINKFNCNSGFYSRWKRHLSDLKNNVHRNTFIQNLYKAYGYKSLRFEIIELSQPELCDENEIKWFSILKPPTNFQGNKTFKKIECTPEGIKNRKYRSGFQHSLETKTKMSRAQYDRIYITKEISSEKLDEIINLVNNKNKTLTKLAKNYKHALTDIYKNLIRYIGEGELNTLKNKSKLNARINIIESNILRTTNLTEKYNEIIPVIIEKYKNGMLIKDIRKIVKINEDLISILIRNNMDKDEIKRIKSQNAKRNN